LALYERRSRHDEHIIASALAPGFEQKRNVEHGERFTPNAGASEKTLFRRGYHGVEDALELRQLHGVTEHTLPKEPSINSSRFSSNMRKSCRDPFDSATARFE
jgi:hypothetical protein